MIQITYFGFDRKKVFNIYLDDILVSSENFQIEKGDKFYTVDYVIPDKIKKTNKEKLTIKFEAANNSRTAGIYYGRLLR